MPRLDPKTGLKGCPSCKTSYTSDGFARNRAYPDGLHWCCRRCQRAKANAAYARNRQHLQKQARKYLARRKEAKAVYDRLYAAKRRGTRTHYQQEYFRAHKDRLMEYFREYGRRWSKTHPEARALKNHARRVRMQKAAKDGTVTRKALRDLLATWAGTCPFCGKEAAPTIDHIVALKAGGAHSMSNLQLMCQSCNSSKGVS